MAPSLPRAFPTRTCQDDARDVGIDVFSAGAASRSHPLVAVRDEHRIVDAQDLNEWVIPVGDRVVPLECPLQLATVGPETAIEVAAAVERAADGAQWYGVRAFVVAALEDAVAKGIVQDEELRTMFLT